MVARRTTFWDDPSDMDWVAEPKPWCPECCIDARKCGCQTGERLVDEHFAAIEEAHIVRGEE